MAPSLQESISKRLIATLVKVSMSLIFNSIVRRGSKTATISSQGEHISNFRSPRPTLLRLNCPPRRLFLEKPTLNGLIWTPRCAAYRWLSRGYQGRTLLALKTQVCSLHQTSPYSQRTMLAKCSSSDTLTRDSSFLHKSLCGVRPIRSIWTGTLLAKVWFLSLTIQLICSTMSQPSSLLDSPRMTSLPGRRVDSRLLELNLSNPRSR